MKNLVLIITLMTVGFVQNTNAQGRRTNTTSTQRGSGDISNMLRSNTSSLVPTSSFNNRQSSAPHPQTNDWKEMSVQEKKEAVNSMTNKDRSVLLQQMKETAVLKDLKISSEKEAAFKSLYSEYQNQQKAIKEKFIIDKNLENLSDDEANKRLNQSFEVGQQLLNNRKAYADKFLQILSPQQVLKLFQTEGKVREKILDKKNNNN